MLLLGLDLETDSLNVAEANIVEVGLAAFDTEVLDIVSVKSFLVNSCTTLPKESHVPLEAVKKYGFEIPSMASEIQALLSTTDFIVAHNGLQYDKPILEATFRRIGRSFPKTPWIDTMLDVPYPDNITTRKLDYLCVEHGFFNPLAHRAIFDVVSMLRILSQYNIPEIIAVASTPVIWLRAMVSIEKKDFAKNLGYRWDGVNKYWVKSLRQFFADIEREKCFSAGFDIITLNDYRYQEEHI